jgi:hypothetical protein
LNCKAIKIYGISQNPYTNDYILVFNGTSGNEQIDNFIQNMQSKGNITFEWIPYNLFGNIKKTGENGYMTVYSAIWRNSNAYKSDSNKEVALKCLHKSQNSVESLINEVLYFYIYN